MPTAYATVAELLTANTVVTSITDCNLVSAITKADVQTVTTGCDRYYTRTYTISDACTHSSTITQKIHVNDVTAPVLTGVLPGGVVGNVCKVNAPPAPSAASIAILYQDCNGTTATLVSSIVTGTDLSWTATNTYTIEDACTNFADNALVIYTGSDTQNPTITCPANVITVTNTDCTAIGVVLGTPDTDDNCTVASVKAYVGITEITPDPPTYAFPQGTTTVTWVVTDGGCNTASCNQTVTVNGLGISGIIRYHNATSTPLKNVKDELWQGGSKVYPVSGEVKTNAAGQTIAANSWTGGIYPAYPTVTVASSNLTGINFLGIGTAEFNRSFIPAVKNGSASLQLADLLTTADFVSGKTIRFTVANDPLNELADGFYDVIPGAVLAADVIESTTSGIVEQPDGNLLNLANHPNPFFDQTILTYTLPFEGHVTLVIDDMMGHRVSILLDEKQSAGEYSVKADAISIQPGVYIATLRLECAKGDFMQKVKMVRVW